MPWTEEQGNTTLSELEYYIFLGVCMREVLVDFVRNTLHFTNKVGVQEAVWGAIQTLREHRSKSNMLLVQVIILIGNQTVLQFLVKDEMCIILRIRYSSISYIGKKEYLWRQCSRISSKWVWSKGETNFQETPRNCKLVMTLHMKISLR